MIALCFSCPLKHEPAEVLSLVSSARVETLLHKRLESFRLLGARFRECARRALLLPRSRVGARMPLWMNRLRSQKLLSAVSRYADFPILLKASGGPAWWMNLIWPASSRCWRA